MAKATTPTTHEVVQQFLADDGWTVVETTDPDLYETRFRGHSGEWTCLAELNEHPSQLVFYSLAPIVVGADRRGVAAELLGRLNDGLAVGGFEMDIDLGEVRFRTSATVDEGVLEERMIRPAIFFNVAMMDQYLAAIMLLASSALDAEEIATIADATPPV